MDLGVYTNFLHGEEEDYSQQALNAMFGKLSEAGITTCWAFVAKDGIAAYPSKILANPYGSDVLQRAAEAAAAQGVELHAMVCPFRTLGPDNPMLIPFQGYGQETSDNKPNTRACPSAKQNRDVALEVLEELLAYKIGIHLDYVRYPNAPRSLQHPCHCPACRQTRREWWGREIFTGEDMQKPGVLYKEIEMRKKNVKSYVVRARALTNEAGVPLSMAARASYPLAALPEGQDWPEWSREGLMDVIATMTYTTDHALFQQRVAEQAGLMANGKAAFWVTIGRASSAGRLTPDELLSQIKVATDLGADGCGIFSLRGMTSQDFNKLKMITEESAKL